MKRPEEYISRRAVIELLTHITFDVKRPCRGDWIEVVGKIPTADVAPVIHARWKPVSLMVSECSNCGKYWIVRGDEYEYNFCPNCGVDMRGEKADEPLQHD